MEKMAVFINDAAHAQHLLQPMLEGGAAAHWVLVACPPTLTRHIGRWVTKASRRQWQERWAQALFEQLGPVLASQPGSVVETIVARRPLVDVSTRLTSRLPGLRLFDAQRQRIGAEDEPISRTQPCEPALRWAAPLALTTGLSAVLALAD